MEPASPVPFPQQNPMHLELFLRRACAASVVALALQAAATAQIGTPPTITVDYPVDTGWVPNRGAARDVILSFDVYQPQAEWLRLYFSEIYLGGDLPAGNQAILRVTSLEDGAVQEMNATHVRQWGNSTAYFNGDAVQVEVVAHPGTGARLVLRAVDAGLAPVDPSICGSADNRDLSSDPRSARLLPVGCTGWLIDDCAHCFLTAGHCQGSISVVQFNVPLSDANGSLNHPGPEDQYTKDNSSLQGNGGLGVGDDWAYFGTFPNANTGLTAFEAQGQSFVLASPPSNNGNRKIRITGYGVDDGVRNQVQQTEFGPLVTASGTTVGYSTDTTGGNSGSPVIWKQTDLAVGIHTHGGCSSSGGNNWGTSTNHAGLQNALANPQGICDCTDPEQVLFSDGFESGDFAAGGWTTQNVRAVVKAVAANEGAFGARLKRATWIERQISTVGFTDIELSVDHRCNNYEAPDELVIEYWNGAAWIVVHATDEIQWHNRNYALGSDAENNPNLAIRLRTTADAAKERSDVDNVVLTGK